MRNPKRALKLRLWDLLNAVATARLAIGDLSLDAFRRDTIRKLAAERCVEIISEAARHVPPESQSNASDIPWRQIIGIGNILRHGYEDIDPEIIWKLVRDDLGPLEDAIRRIMAELEDR
jgi:uncharacterized protein with HEPN domain